MLVLPVHMTYSNLILETFYNTSLKKAWKMVDNLDTLIKPLTGILVVSIMYPKMTFCSYVKQ